MNLFDVFRTPAARVPLPTTGEPGIRDIPDPDEVVIPLEFRQGLVLPPVVQAGDTVRRHQVIGQAEGGISVHASVAGKIHEIQRVWTAAGDHVAAVVIRKEEGLEAADSLPDPGSATRLQLLKAGGVVSPWTTTDDDPTRNAFQHLVILGHDVEPTQHVQELLIQERTSALIKGLRLLRDMAPGAAIAMTVPHRLLDWAQENLGPELNLLAVPDQYRERLDRTLVARLTGVTVPGRTPYTSRGVGVMTAEAVMAAQDAQEGRPMVHKTLTVSGAGVPRPLTVRVPLGTKVKDVLAAVGLDIQEAGRVLAGGPMRGVALFTDETPVDKFQHGIHLLPTAQIPAEVNRICVNCGRCVRACPVHLQVHLIGRCAEFGQLDESLNHHPEACFECGLCAFVCPAGRPLVQLVKLARLHARRSA
jgi:electron transport complex protein RnfC